MSKHLFAHARLACRPVALLAGGWCIATGAHATAQESPSQIRSITDVRQRIPDEHDRPYFRETQSHRGFEIREPQFTVIAETSRADALLAAKHVQESWHQASKLADQWTSRHHEPDFALNNLQVVITNEPTRERDAPFTTVNVVGIQTQVQINAAPGQPPLSEQIVRLRDGAAFALFHAVGLDAVSPPWVVAGMAAFAGRAGLPEEAVQQALAKTASTPFGGQQWRFHRSAQDRLDDPAANHEEMASQVAFLLTGNDAQNAPALFSDLRQANLRADNLAAAGNAFSAFPGNAHPIEKHTSLDSLLELQSGELAAWKSNPQRGQPVFAPVADIDAEVLSAQRDLLVLLKLERRLAALPSNAAAPSVAKAGGPKVVEFTREQGAAVSRPVSARNASPNFAALASRLLDSDKPWATIDSDGSLLLSTNRSRIEQLLSPPSGRLALARENGKSVLKLQADNGTTIRGWLDENPDDKSRPLARFETVAAKTRPIKVNPPIKPEAAKQAAIPSGE